MTIVTSPWWVVCYIWYIDGWAMGIQISPPYCTKRHLGVLGRLWTPNIVETFCTTPKDENGIN